ncbi:hypothetical protein PMAYCL1PPCAC_19561, partial [Pristionchus mayeri]
MEQLSSIKSQYLRASHFSSSDFIHNANGTVLRPGAVPSFNDELIDERAEATKSTKKVIPKGWRVATKADKSLKAQKPPEFKENPQGFADDSAPIPPLFGNETPIKEEPIEFKEEPIDDLCQIKVEVFCPSTGNSRPIGLPIIEHPFFYQIKRYKCVVCQQIRKVNEMHEFTSNSTRRTMWVDAVRSTPEGRMSLMELLCTRKRPYICASHFSPSDY